MIIIRLIINYEWLIKDYVCVAGVRVPDNNNTLRILARLCVVLPSFGRRWSDQVDSLPSCDCHWLSPTLAPRLLNTKKTQKNPNNPAICRGQCQLGWRPVPRQQWRGHSYTRAPPPSDWGRLSLHSSMATFRYVWTQIVHRNLERNRPDLENVKFKMAAVIRKN